MQFRMSVFEAEKRQKNVAQVRKWRENIDPQQLEEQRRKAMSTKEDPESATSKSNIIALKENLEKISVMAKPGAAVSKSEKHSGMKTKIKPGPPKDKTAYSSNWKKMLITFEPSKRKRKGNPERDKQKKLKLEECTDDTKEKHEAVVDSASSSKKEALLLDNAVTHTTKALAMDCEMVGVGTDGEESILARVSVVNQHGYCIYDKFVRPREKVTDYRTHVSGVRPVDLKHAEEFLVVQKEVYDLLKDRIIVGHALHNDLKVLFLDFPMKNIRDTSRYKPFRQLAGSGRPSLKKLSLKVLGVAVQEGEHNSVQDAQAAMALYMMYRKRWEADLFNQGIGKMAGRKKKKATESANSKLSKTVRFAECWSD